MLGTLSVHSFKGLFIAALIFALSACGGGGGGGGGGKASSSSVNSLVANAGPDRSFNAGDRIELKANVAVVGEGDYVMGGGTVVLKGSSTNPKDVVLISWTKTSGPDVSLMSNGVRTADAFFIAPSTGTAKSITITYKLTITTVDGTSAEDLVTFTINRVNLAPTADAGQDTSADSGTTVTLTGAGNDLDGTIASYNWAQTSGESVILTSTTTAETSFEAPSTAGELDLEFTLTATDNDGAKTTDTVLIHVVASDSPRVVMAFPPVGGIYTESTISAFGTVTAKTGSITSVQLTIGSTTIDADLDNEGNWRADNIAIPGGTSAKLQVLATDSNGLTGKATSNLQLTKNATTDYLLLGDAYGLVVDSFKKMAYFITSGDSTTDVALYSVDLVTGKKSSAISNFANAQQGLSPIYLTSLAYSAEQRLIYAGTAVNNYDNKIISIDTLTGVRAIVSDTTKGTGTGLGNPTGLALGTNNTLYVADNELDSIFAVNTETGDRTIIADTNSSIYAINKPSFVAMDNTLDSERLFLLGNAYKNYVLQMNPLLTPVVNDVVTNSTDLTQGDPITENALGFALDSKANTLFVAEKFGDIVRVDIATGNRVKLMDSSPFSTKITYDTQHQLLYLLDGTPANLYVADPVSGQKVLISRGN